MPQGHRLFRKHGYGPNMMRCQSLLGLDGCSRVPTHLKLVTLVPLQSRQRPSQVVQLSEQLECNRSRRLSEVDSLSAPSVVAALFDARCARATGLAWPNFDCEWTKILVRGRRQPVRNLCMCYIWRHSHSGNLAGANARKRPPAGKATARTKSNRQ